VSKKAATGTLLDASAVLAFLQGEPGAELVRVALEADNCWVGAANQAEIIAKSIDRGVDRPSLEAVLADLAYTVVAITPEDGAQAGWLRQQTRAMGLSMGDRLCLAQAQRLNAKVLTTDRPWLNVAADLGLAIQCIRPGGH
jgi:ribonuclease VapC